MRIPKIAFLFLYIGTPAFATDLYKTVFSPYTGKLDYVTKISSTTITPDSVCFPDGSCLTTASASGAGTAYQGLILIAPNATAYGVTVHTTGALITTSTSGVPSGYVKFNSVVLKDSSGNYWTVTVNNSGTLITTAGGSYASAIERVVLNDSNSIGWILTVSTGGNLVTS